MDIVALLPFIVLIGAMFLMTRSAKNKQRAAANMRNQMQPGTGVRTIGGLYATVKEVNHDTVVVEIAPGVHATFAKNSIGAVLEDAEFDRIVNGVTDADPLEGDDVPVVPDSPAGLEPIDLGKSESTTADADADADDQADDAAADGDDDEVADAAADTADGKKSLKKDAKAADAKAADADAAEGDARDDEEGPAAK